MLRLLDIILSLLGMVILSPLLLTIYIIVIFESKGGGVYTQKRVGMNDIEFNLYKFRSMSVGSDKKGLLTLGIKDFRITRIGNLIRHFKLDELPQLYNVFIGDMSLVGPRPEVRKYVDLYSIEQRKVLSVMPGITDYASIEYVNENIILGSALNPEKVYIEEIMPNKICLSMKYIENRSVKEYYRIILLTFWQIIIK